ncbi:MAG: response regulator transcription factor [Chloroflexi bacterium]|nr:response regulator transcription factor [Chloroflexota bacterium]
MPEQTSAKAIKVMIVDDHPVVRDGLRLSILDKPDMMLAAEDADGFQAEETALKVKPDVILMDVSMPGRDGLETMLSIKQKLPDVKVLVLTVSERYEDLLRAVRMGAHGYLSKRLSAEEIINAVKRAAAGEVILSPDMTAKLMDELKKKATEPSLSPREEEILALVGEGLTTAEIAKRLYLGEGTVSTYVRRLLDKLHLRHRAEAIAYAISHSPRK